MKLHTSTHLRELKPCLFSRKREKRTCTQDVSPRIAFAILPPARRKIFGTHHPACQGYIDARAKHCDHINLCTYIHPVHKVRALSLRGLRGMSSCCQQEKLASNGTATSAPGPANGAVHESVKVIAVIFAL